MDPVTTFKIIMTMWTPTLADASDRSVQWSMFSQFFIPISESLTDLQVQPCCDQPSCFLDYADPSLVGGL